MYLLRKKQLYFYNFEDLKLFYNYFDYYYIVIIDYYYIFKKNFII